MFFKAEMLCDVPILGPVCGSSGCDHLFVRDGRFARDSFPTMPGAGRCVGYRWEATGVGEPLCLYVPAGGKDGNKHIRMCCKDGQGRLIHALMVVPGCT